MDGDVIKLQIIFNISAILYNIKTLSLLLCLQEL